MLVGGAAGLSVEGVADLGVLVGAQSVLSLRGLARSRVADRRSVTVFRILRVGEIRGLDIV